MRRLSRKNLKLTQLCVITMKSTKVKTESNCDCQHCEKHPIFQNKDCLKLVVAENPMDICQTDLVVMEKNPSKDKSNKICQYILNILDVFQD